MGNNGNRERLKSQQVMTAAMKLKEGIHVNPWLIHAKVWQKPLQYCKVISLQLIKINGKKKKRLASWKESYDQPRQHIKKERHYFANRGPSSQLWFFR